MKRVSRLSTLIARPWRKLDLGFFWQLIIAFTLITAIVGGGMFLAGRVALGKLDSLVRAGFSPASLWADRLASYYGGQGGWEGVDALIAGYPRGSGWGPWNEDWQVGYVLAAADGTVVSASDEGRLGQTLGRWERELATPIVADGGQVGFLVLSPFVHAGPGPLSVAGHALRTFLMAGVVIGGGSLIVGLILSRGMSRPLMDLTRATRAVAAGDLSARVPVRHQGEVRELTVEERVDEIARSVIQGKLEGVLDGVYPATSEHIEPILEETRLLSHLVEDLRLLALAEAGQLALDRRAMDVGDLLRDAQVNFGPQAADRGVTLALDVPPELPRVMADWRRIAQVLGNLLTNALRHTPQGGCVTLSAAVILPPAGRLGGVWSR